MAERIGPLEIVSLLQLCVADGIDGPSYIAARLCRAASAQDHDIVARHLYAIESAGIAQLQHTVINTALAFAVKNAQSRFTRDLLIAGADANLVLDDNFSIVDLAIYFDSNACLSLLLEHGANPDGSAFPLGAYDERGMERHPQRFPSIDKHHVVPILRDVPEARNPYSPFAYAIRLDRRVIAEVLLQAGAKMNEITEKHLSTAMKGELYDLLKDTPKFRHRLLALAIKLDRRDIARELLQAGADVNEIQRKDSSTPIKGDTNDFLKDMYSVGNLYSPLSYAIKLGRREIAQDFLKAGADDKVVYTVLGVRLNKDGSAGDLDGVPEKSLRCRQSPRPPRDSCEPARSQRNEAKEDWRPAMAGALQREDPYLIYLISYSDCSQKYKESVLNDYPSLRDASTIAQAHSVRSSTWPHLYQQDRLSRDDFHTLWTQLGFVDRPQELGGPVLSTATCDSSWD